MKKYFLNNGLTYNKIKSVILYILLPILLGTGIYLFADNFSKFKLIRNYMPDGLWAFAFTLSILTIWDHKINPFWIGLLMLSFIAFEYLQYLQILPGTGDWKDVLCYFIFATIALIFNNVYLKKSV